MLNIGPFVCIVARVIFRAVQSHVSVFGGMLEAAAIRESPTKHFCVRIALQQDNSVLSMTSASSCNAAAFE